MTLLTQRLGEWTLPAQVTMRWNEGHLERSSFSCLQKISYYAQNIIKSLGALAILCVVGLYLAIKYLYSYARGTLEPEVLPRPPHGTNIPEIPPNDFAKTLPHYVGFPSSIFQDGGVGSRFCPTADLEGRNQWDPFLTPEHIDGTAPEDFPEFFVDILGHPETCSQGLSDIMRPTAHRLSLEWSVLQPVEGEGYSEIAIRLYKKLFAEMKANDIEPFVTIHHFTHPLWFEERGAFLHKENCNLYLDFAFDMMQIFPEVRHWYTFNEIGAFTLEGLLRDHPSPIRNIHHAGKTLRNMLMTHCRLYAAAKERDSSLRIGLTHQWLKFYPINNNLLERTVCNLAEKVAHTAIYDFFRTGIFTFQVPGQSNLHFSIPEEEFFQKNHRFLDFIGLQFYGPAFIILGSNGGHRYPGHKIVNFTCGPLGFSFGGTAPIGSRVMSFGPTIHPESLLQNLEEAASLDVDIHISEIGVDAKTQGHGEPDFQIDRDRQLTDFQRYVSILALFQERITAVFPWTLHGRFEWNRGHEPRLNIAHLTKHQNGRPRQFVPHPLGLWLAQEFAQVRERVQTKGESILTY